MKSLLILLFISSVMFAQYSNDDEELIKTTFLREFESSILESYINSEDENKVNAALLSIAQSEDTSLTGLTVKPDFPTHGKYIAFALGQLGQSDASAEYLLDKISGQNSSSLKYCYEALGKTGSAKHIEKLLELYEQNALNTDGLPYAFYNFNIRGITDSTGREVNILYNELRNNLHAPGKTFDALFALYRISTEIKDERLLIDILKGDYDAQCKTYALGIFRKMEYFPSDSELFTKIANDTSWSIRCEEARTLCYYNFATIDNITSYINLIKDNNPNVARAAAQSAAFLNIPDSTLKEKYISLLTELINSDEITYNAKGELAISLHSLGARSTKELVEQYKDVIPESYLYALLGSSPDNVQYSFEYLLKDLLTANERNKALIHMQIAGMFDSLRTDQVFIKYLYDVYKSGSPISIAIYNETIDSSFITENSAWLQQMDSLSLSQQNK